MGISGIRKLCCKAHSSRARRSALHTAFGTCTGALAAVVLRCQVRQRACTSQLKQVKLAGWKYVRERERHLCILYLLEIHEVLILETFVFPPKRGLPTAFSSDREFEIREFRTLSAIPTRSTRFCANKPCRGCRKMHKVRPVGRPRPNSQFLARAASRWGRTKNSRPLCLPRERPSCF